MFLQVTSITAYNDLLYAVSSIDCCVQIVPLMYIYDLFEANLQARDQT